MPDEGPVEPDDTQFEDEGVEPFEEEQQQDAAYEGESADIMISNNEVDVDDSSEIPNQSENPSGANASTTVVIAQNSDDQSNTENSVQQQETQQIQTISASDSGSSSQSTSQNTSQNWRSQTTQNVSRQQPVNST